MVTILFNEGKQAKNLGITTSGVSLFHFHLGSIVLCMIR